MKEFGRSVARWPLLLGAMLCLTLGLSISLDAGQRVLVVGVLVTLGSVLLGAWIWALATHTNPPHREPETPEPPSPPREGQDGEGGS